MRNFYEGFFFNVVSELYLYVGDEHFVNKLQMYKNIQDTGYKCLKYSKQVPVF